MSLQAKVLFRSAINILSSEPQAPVLDAQRYDRRQSVSKLGDALLSRLPLGDSVLKPIQWARLLI